MSEANNIALADKISEWLKDYLKRHGLKRFIVGVSGGIDSALVSTLCARTGEPVTVVTIDINSSEVNTRRALAQCEWLRKNFSNVSVCQMVLNKSFEVLWHQTFTRSDKESLQAANMKSRLRMIALYNVATAENGIVVGTGNKVEDFGVGFFTKYGDGGVDISPIADLNKSEVREMARVLGVSEDIVTAPPTDGLWEDNRTDEEQIGASYEELEWAMSFQYSTEQERKRELTPREKTVLEIYKKFNNQNRHKMVPIPIFKVAR